MQRFVIGGGGDEADSTPLAPTGTPTRVASTQMVERALEGLRSLVRGVSALSFILFALIIIMFVGAILLDLTTTTFFQLCATYRIFLTPIFVMAARESMIFWSTHNLVRSSYIFYQIVVIIILIPLGALWGWVWVEIFYWCPTKLPDYCTDTVNPDLETGYIVWASGVLITFPVFVVSLILLRSASRYQRELASSFGLTSEEAEKMVTDALTGKSTRYVKGIGMEQSF